MTNEELKEFGAICQEVKDIKLNWIEFQRNLNTRLDAIDLKLGNHVNHISSDIGKIQSDINWIIRVKKENTEMKPEDAVQNNNIDWITKLIWSFIGVVGAVIANLIGKVIGIFIK